MAGDAADGGSSRSMLALDAMLQQLGRLAVRIAVLETALEARDTGCVVETMRTVTAEWHLLRTDFSLLQAATQKCGDVMTMPPAMQAVRRSVRNVIRWSRAYVAQQVSSQEELAHP